MGKAGNFETHSHTTDNDFMLDGQKVTVKTTSVQVICKIGWIKKTVFVTVNEFQVILGTNRHITTWVSTTKEEMNIKEFATAWLRKTQDEYMGSKHSKGDALSGKTL